MSLSRREQIMASLRDKESRDAFVDDQINVGLSFELRAMREARGWSHADLEDRLGTPHGWISRLEGLGYNWQTLATLKQIASVFDVGLVVRFAPFSELVDWEVGLSPEAVAVPSFDEEETCG